MKKLKLSESSASLSREEMKKILAGSGSCSGSCSIGTSKGSCYTSIAGGCGCTALGIGSYSC